VRAAAYTALRPSARAWAPISEAMKFCYTTMPCRARVGWLVAAGRTGGRQMTAAVTRTAAGRIFIEGLLGPARLLQTTAAVQHAARIGREVTRMLCSTLGALLLAAA